MGVCLFCLVRGRSGWARIPGVRATCVDARVEQNRQGGGGSSGCRISLGPGNALDNPRRLCSDRGCWRQTSKGGRIVAKDGKQAAESKRGRARSARVPSSPAPRPPSDVTDGPALVVAPLDPAQGSQPGSSNAPRGSSEVGRGTRARKRAGKDTPQEPMGSRSTKRAGGYMEGGPAKKGGGRPKCGSLTAAGGPSAVATDSPNPSISPDIPSISSDDIHSSSGDYIPREETYPPESEIPLVSVEIHTHQAGIPPYFPEPGSDPSALKAPRVAKSLGRDQTGKIIPHERDELIARKISQWVALGATDNEISNYLGVRPGVLRKEYKDEMANGKFENDMAVGCTILEKAKSGESERMMLFYAKARMGWRESDANDQNNAALLNIHIHT